MMRALYMMKYGSYSPSNHLCELNPHIDVWSEDTERPLQFVTEKIPVKDRRNFTGLTARAHGGTIAHLIVQGEVDTEVRQTAFAAFSPPQISFWPGGGGRLEESAKPS